ncbi:hypothetical protein B0H65DRAFT_439583 [Neurospora tetraspora]|uniref:Uncharacterized protein n=1 Tax=Neurospora tetraspora TaxID=94610 RepID=A0AAE0MTJ1_9PEZI|nr:hypothetical protein B0H65DRAFT_439583 [Neurospora tetraspora]
MEGKAPSSTLTAALVVAAVAAGGVAGAGAFAAAAAAVVVVVIAVAVAVAGAGGGGGGSSGANPRAVGLFGHRAGEKDKSELRKAMAMLNMKQWQWTMLETADPEKVTQGAGGREVKAPNLSEAAEIMDRRGAHKATSELRDQGQPRAQSFEKSRDVHGKWNNGKLRSKNGKPRTPQGRESRGVDPPSARRGKPELPRAEHQERVRQEQALFRPTVNEGMDEELVQAAVDWQLGVGVDEEGFWLSSRIASRHASLVRLSPSRELERVVHFCLPAWISRPRAVSHFSSFSGLRRHSHSDSNFGLRELRVPSKSPAFSRKTAVRTGPFFDDCKWRRLPQNVRPVSRRESKILPALLMELITATNHRVTRRSHPPLPTSKEGRLETASA